MHVGSLLYCIELSVRLHLTDMTVLPPGGEPSAPCLSSCVLTYISGLFMASELVWWLSMVTQGRLGVTKCQCSMCNKH